MKSMSLLKDTQPIQALVAFSTLELPLLFLQVSHQSPDDFETCVCHPPNSPQYFWQLMGLFVSPYPSHKCFSTGGAPQHPEHGSLWGELSCSDRSGAHHAQEIPRRDR